MQAPVNRVFGVYGCREYEGAVLQRVFDLTTFAPLVEGVWGAGVYDDSPPRQLAPCVVTTRPTPAIPLPHNPGQESYGREEGPPPDSAWTPNSPPEAVLLQGRDKALREIIRSYDECERMTFLRRVAKKLSCK
jgi:hypothetical protein